MSTLAIYFNENGAEEMHLNQIKFIFNFQIALLKEGEKKFNPAQ